MDVMASCFREIGINCSSLLRRVRISTNNNHIYAQNTQIGTNGTIFGCLCVTKRVMTPRTLAARLVLAKCVGMPDIFPRRSWLKSSYLSFIIFGTRQYCVQSATVIVNEHEKKNRSLRYVPV